MIYAYIETTKKYTHIHTLWRLQFKICNLQIIRWNLRISNYKYRNLITKAKPQIMNNSRVGLIDLKARWKIVQLNGNHFKIKQERYRK